jgi:hypothetical protein
MDLVDLIIGNGGVLDGVQLWQGDCILIKDQINPAENGVYRYHGVRLHRVDKFVSPLHVRSGKLNVDTEWIRTRATDSDQWGWVQTSGPVTYQKLDEVTWKPPAWLESGWS